MGLSPTEYAPARQAPLLLSRAVEQTISAPVRYGSTGALQAPASGTVTVRRPDQTALVSGAAVTVSSSAAQYTLTPSASETFGAGWTVEWSLTMTDGVFRWREEAFLCEWVPPNAISAADLYRVKPELRYRVPEAQGANGTNEGWQPQIDAAYYELIQRLIDDGRRPWLIRSVSGYRLWLLSRAVQIAVGAIPSVSGDDWDSAKKAAHFDMVRAAADLSIQYAEDDAGVRIGGSPVIRLSSPGRPAW